MTKQAGDTTLLLGAMAGAASLGAACMWAYHHHQRWVDNKESNNKNKKYKIPIQLLQSPYGQEIQVAVQAALKGALLRVYIRCAIVLIDCSACLD
jgi:hypothetical protein